MGLLMHRWYQPTCRMVCWTTWNCRTSWLLCMIFCYHGHRISNIPQHRVSIKFKFASNISSACVTVVSLNKMFIFCSRHSGRRVTHRQLEGCRGPCCVYRSTAVQGHVKLLNAELKHCSKMHLKC